MNCPLCTSENQKILWSNEHFYIIDAQDKFFPCFLRVISKKHISEMSCLTSDEKKMLWDILDIIEEEMLSTLHPDKINYAQFGNMVPHLHWHIIARWKNDTHFPESPWGKQQRPISQVEFEKQRAKIPVLADRITKALNSYFHKKEDI